MFYTDCVRIKSGLVEYHLGPVHHRRRRRLQRLERLER